MQSGDRPLIVTASGDVARDLGDPDHVPGIVPDRRHAQHDFDQRPILALARRVGVLDELAQGDTTKELALLGLVAQRSERPRRPAECLLRRIAEEALGRVIPVGDDPV
ncbi:MAG: hypothetical protein ABJB39_09315, partial [Chloroflexota bacterium]